jgi:hypothetical protein
MISLKSKHTQIIPLINEMLEKSHFKSAQLLLDQVVDHLQRCCRNILHISLGTVEEWALLGMNLKLLRMLLKVQERRYGDWLLLLSWHVSRKIRPRNLVFNLKPVMLFRSNGSSKESWMLRIKFAGTRQDWCVKDRGEGVDYSHTFAPGSKFASIRLLRYTSLDWFSWMSLRQFSILM